MTRSQCETVPTRYQRAGVGIRTSPSRTDRRFRWAFLLAQRKGHAMTDMLQEFFDSRGVAMRVDRPAGVIRGVKMLGLESRNGRTYLPEALAQAARLYEDAKVNVNHPKGNPAGPRDYQDRIGSHPPTSRHEPARGCSPTSTSIPSTRWPSSSSGTPSTPRRTWASRTTSRHASAAAATAWSSRRSPACRASIWWPIRPPRADCSRWQRRRRPKQSPRRC